jgi:hypothetical protein
MSRYADEPGVPIFVVIEEVGEMTCRGIDPALKRMVERGEYLVDSRAVAEAVLRSGVLVAAQAGDRAVTTEED